MNEEWPDNQILCDACGGQLDAKDAVECEACGRQPLCEDCVEQLEHDCTEAIVDDD